MSALRQLGILVVLLLVVAGIWAWRAGSAAPEARQVQRRAVPVEVAPVRQDTVREVVEAVGSTRAADSVTLETKTAGRVTELHLEAGKPVAKGDVLARLDSDAESAAVAEAKAALTDAQSKFDRANALQATRAVSAATLDEARATLKGAQARLASAQARLDDRTVVAPFSGVLGLRAVSVGAQLGTGTAIATLDALDRLELEFTVPERFFPDLKPGLTVEASAAAFPGRLFPGSVFAIDSRVDPISRTVRVRARLPNPDLELPAGLFMTATLVLKEHPGLLVPEQAVVLEAGHSFVYRVKDGKAERMAVVLGERRPGEVTVDKGISAEDTVVTAGLQRLRDGSPVEVTDPAKEPGGAPPPPQQQGDSSGAGPARSAAETPAPADRRG